MAQRSGSYITKDEGRESQARKRKFERLYHADEKKNGKRATNKKREVIAQWFADLLEQAVDDPTNLIHDLLRFGFVHGYKAAKGDKSNEQLPELIRSGGWGKVRLDLKADRRNWQTREVENEALKFYKRQWFS